MRLTRLHAPTLKDVPRDADVVSQRLLLRGGYLRKLAAGIYDYLPLARRVLRKVETIIREEMDAADAQEVLLPFVQPAELWKESGRWEKYGPELARLKDRKDGDFCLGPTHEEVIVDLVRRDVRSWRALPLNLYQIQAKFRDEIRPRAGLMRGREFIMKDAYSFDVDDDAADVSYDAMYAAYERIFARCGLDFRAVEADTGAIGGSRSHEFQVLADSGEDAIVACTECDYAANVEQAELPPPAAADGGAASAAAAVVSTPEQRTIEEVAGFLDRPATAFIKTLVFRADDELVVALVRGDHELNEVKLKKAVGATTVELASEEEVRALTGAPVGFAGPVGLEGARIVADVNIAGMRDAVTGANQADAHLLHVDEGRDFSAGACVDLRLAQPGDPCPRCGGALQDFRGIEVGHVFFLGTVYSESMRCNYLDEQSKERPMVMGCYGIGVTRIMAAAVEQNHDDRGIVWPLALAPYAVTVLPLQMNKPDVVEAAERIYSGLKAAGVEVLIDDRKERAGSKFADAELMGIPYRVAIGGRGLAEGALEVKARTGEQASVPPDEVVAWLLERLS